MQYLQLKPAYGRKPKSKKEVIDLWNDNKDFSMLDLKNWGRKINKSDFLRYRNEGDLKGVQALKVRINNLRDVVVINLDELED